MENDTFPQEIAVDPNDTKSVTCGKDTFRINY